VSTLSAVGGKQSVTLLQHLGVIGGFDWGEGRALQGGTETTGEPVAPPP